MFWMSFSRNLDLVEIMLDLILASREGNWPLHLARVEDLILWCFAYNCTTPDACPVICKICIDLLPNILS